METLTRAPGTTIGRPPVKGQEVLGPQRRREVPAPSVGGVRPRQHAVVGAPLMEVVEATVGMGPLSEMKRPLGAGEAKQPTTTPQLHVGPLPLP